MKKLIFCFCLISLTLSAQDSIEKELDSIVDIDLAKDFISENKSKANKLITFNEVKHKTSLAKDLFELPKGRLKTVQNEYGKTYYKVIEKKTIPHYRVSYIFLDANKLSVSEISEKRDEIVSKYNNGVPFRSLANYYSMDNTANRGGDLGWFAKGDMPEEFEESVIDGGYSINQMFMVYVKSKHCYYIVLKTHESMDIKEIEVLKIVESRK